MIRTMRRAFACLLAAVFACSQLPAALAAPVLIFSNETNEQNANKLVLDNDNTGGNVTLQFGATLGEQLYWNNAGSTFTFTDDVNVTGNLDVDGTITAGSGGVAITNAAGNIDGEQIAADTIDDDSIDFGMGTDQVGADDIAMTDEFDNSSGTNVQDVVDDIDAAVGNLNYSSNNYVTDSNDTTTAIGALDSQLGTVTSSGHTQNTDTSSTANTFTLDVDNTGGNVTLQFGATLGEQLYWNNAGSTFTFTDDLNVTGNLDVDGTLTTGSSNIALTNAAGNIDGEVIQDDSIDDDSIDWADVTSTDITFDADTVGTTAVFNGTTSLEESAAANDSGASIVGAFDEFDNSTGSNVQDVLDDIDAAIGDRAYTNDNYVTDGETATSSIDVLDTQVKANADAIAGGSSTKRLHISMNDITVLADGATNLGNIYADSETGVNPHQYYLLKTGEAVLQDLDLKIKVKLPQDFSNFTTASNDVSFFYKNTGTNNTDSRIDILVEDDDGDDAYTATNGQGLFNAAWTEYTDEFDGGSFNPLAGEYIYITIKGYSSYDSAYQSPYMGELVITYTAG